MHQITQLKLNPVCGRAGLVDPSMFYKDKTAPTCSATSSPSVYYYPEKPRVFCLPHKLNGISFSLNLFQKQSSASVIIYTLFPASSVQERIKIVAPILISFVLVTLGDAAACLKQLYEILCPGTFKHLNFRHNNDRR